MALQSLSRGETARAPVYREGEDPSYSSQCRGASSPLGGLGDPSIPLFSPITVGDHHHRHQHAVATGPAVEKEGGGHPQFDAAPALSHPLAVHGGGGGGSAGNQMYTPMGIGGGAGRTFSSDLFGPQLESFAETPHHTHRSNGNGRGAGLLSLGGGGLGMGRALLWGSEGGTSPMHAAQMGSVRSVGDGLPTTPPLCVPPGGGLGMPASIGHSVPPPQHSALLPQALLMVSQSGHAAEGPGGRGGAQMNGDAPSAIMQGAQRAASPASSLFTGGSGVPSAEPSPDRRFLMAPLPTGSGASGSSTAGSGGDTYMCLQHSAKSAKEPLSSPQGGGLGGLSYMPSSASPSLIVAGQLRSAVSRSTCSDGDGPLGVFGGNAVGHQFVSVATPMGNVVASAASLEHLIRVHRGGGGASSSTGSLGGVGGGAGSAYHSSPSTHLALGDGASSRLVSTSAQPMGVATPHPTPRGAGLVAAVPHTVEGITAEGHRVLVATPAALVPPPPVMVPAAQPPPTLTQQGGGPLVAPPVYTAALGCEVYTAAAGFGASSLTGLANSLRSRVALSRWGGAVSAEKSVTALAQSSPVRGHAEHLCAQGTNPTTFTMAPPIVQWSPVKATGTTGASPLTIGAGWSAGQAEAERAPPSSLVIPHAAVPMRSGGGPAVAGHSSGAGGTRVGALASLESAATAMATTSVSSIGGFGPAPFRARTRPKLQSIVAAQRSLNTHNTASIGGPVRSRGTNPTVVIVDGGGDARPPPRSPHEEEGVAVVGLPSEIDQLCSIGTSYYFGSPVGAGADEGRAFGAALGAGRSITPTNAMSRRTPTPRGGGISYTASGSGGAVAAGVTASPLVAREGLLRPLGRDGCPSPIGGTRGGGCVSLSALPSSYSYYGGLGVGGSSGTSASHHDEYGALALGGGPHAPMASASNMPSGVSAVHLHTHVASSRMVPLGAAVSTATTCSSYGAVMAGSDGCSGSPRGGGLLRGGAGAARMARRALSAEGEGVIPHQQSHPSSHAQQWVSVLKSEGAESRLLGVTGSTSRPPGIGLLGASVQGVLRVDRGPPSPSVGAISLSPPVLLASAGDASMAAGDGEDGASCRGAHYYGSSRREGVVPIIPVMGLGPTHFSLAAGGRQREGGRGASVASFVEIVGPREDEEVNDSRAAPQRFLDSSTVQAGGGVCSPQGSPPSASCPGALLAPLKINAPPAKAHGHSGQFHCEAGMGSVGQGGQGQGDGAHHQGGPRSYGASAGGNSTSQAGLSMSQGNASISIGGVGEGPAPVSMTTVLGCPPIPAVVPPVLDGIHTPSTGSGPSASVTLHVATRPTSPRQYAYTPLAGDGVSATVTEVPPVRSGSGGGAATPVDASEVGGAERTRAEPLCDNAGVPLATAAAVGLFPLSCVDGFSSHPSTAHSSGSVSHPIIFAGAAHRLAHHMLSRPEAVAANTQVTASVAANTQVTASVAANTQVTASVAANTQVTASVAEAQGTAAPYVFTLSDHYQTDCLLGVGALGGASVGGCATPIPMLRSLTTNGGTAASSTSSCVPPSSPCFGAQ